VFPTATISGTDEKSYFTALSRGKNNFCQWMGFGPKQYILSQTPFGAVTLYEISDTGMLTKTTKPVFDQ
jgi:hypothetical protein